MSLAIRAIVTVVCVVERWRSPFASSEAVQRRMSVQRSKDTLPELAVRRALHAMGLRYRVHLRPLTELRRQADIVFTRARIAVFIDGCFWHGCPEHGRRHHDVNGWYWPEKIDRNKRRDADTDKKLCDAGWSVMRVWEHEDAYKAAQRIAEAVRSGSREEASSSRW